MATVTEKPKSTDKDRFVSIPVDYIFRSQYQPRKSFDEESLQGLADSIDAQGLLQPLIVRQINPLRYELIAGERRWRAACLAGFQDVPCIVKKCDNERAIQYALIENIQRQDLNALEEAEGIQRLIEEFGYTHEQAATALGKSRPFVTNRLRLLTLSDAVKNFLLMEEIEAGHAAVLAGLEPAWQIMKAQEIVKKKLSVRQFEKMIQTQFNRTNKRTQKKTDPDVRSLANRLSELTGCSTEIEHSGKGGGKLVVTYHSPEELEGYLKFFESTKNKT